MLPHGEVLRLGRLRWSSVSGVWLLSRATVLLALLVAHVTSFNERGGLLAWDTVWYRDIAEAGYAAAPPGAVRFFPLWPLVGRAVAGALGSPAGLTLVVLANVAAFGYLALARRLAQVEIPGRGVDLVPAVVAFAPAGTVLVMGYTEALYGILLCAAFLWMRRGQWVLCAVVALVIGALRPTGVVLALPIAIEAARGLRSATPRGVAARLLAIAAPLLGLAPYLAWAWSTYGDPLTPFRAQLDPTLRGATFFSPLRSLGNIADLLSTREIVGMVLNLAFLLVTLALLLVTARRLPLSYTVFSGVTVLLAVTARDFSSFERYACSAVPLLLAAAMVLHERPRLRRSVMVAAPVVLFGQALLTFGGWYLP
jgi:hypothetical protein